jgi:anti-anti-sigma factor
MAVMEVIGLQAEVVEDRSSHGDGPGQRVNLAGEIDMVTAPTLAAALDLAFAERCQVTVDMAGVTFMGSSGVATLVHARKRLRAVDGDLSVTNVAPHVRRVLEICGLADLFHQGNPTI